MVNANTRCVLGNQQASKYTNRPGYARHTALHLRSHCTAASHKTTLLLSCIQSSLSAAKLWMCFMQQTCFVTHWHTQSYAALSLLFPSCGSLKSCTHIPSAPQLTVLSYKLTSDPTKSYSSSCDGKTRCPANPVLSSQTLRANVSVTLRPLRWQTWNCCPFQVQDTKETR